MSTTALPPVTPGVDVQASRQPQLYAASTITFVLAVIAVILRFLSRKLLKTNYWLDDWLSVAALVSLHTIQIVLHRDN